MSSYITLHQTKTTGTTGDWTRVPPAPMGPLLRGFLDSAGGTATINVYGRSHAGSNERLLCTFTLSGASDEATPYLLQEPWVELQARTTLAGGATATCDMEY